MNFIRKISSQHHAIYGLILVWSVVRFIPIQGYLIDPPVTSSKILNAMDLMCLCNMAEQFVDNPWSSPFDNALQRLSLRTSIQEQKMLMVLRSTRLDTLLSILEVNKSDGLALDPYLPSSYMAHNDLMNDMDIMCLENQVNQVINSEEESNICHENYHEALKNRIMHEMGIVQNRIHLLEQAWSKLPPSNSHRELSTPDVESLMQSIQSTLNDEVTHKSMAK